MARWHRDAPSAGGDRRGDRPQPINETAVCRPTCSRPRAALSRGGQGLACSDGADDLCEFGRSLVCGDGKGFMRGLQRSSREQSEPRTPTAHHPSTKTATDVGERSSSRRDGNGGVSTHLANWACDERGAPGTATPSRPQEGALVAEEPSPRPRVSSKRSRQQWPAVLQKRPTRAAPGRAPHRTFSSPTRGRFRHANHNAGPAEPCWTIEPAPHRYGLEHRASSLSQGPFPLARAAFLHSPPTRRMPTSAASRFT
jgi:hypothetical protein